MDSKHTALLAFACSFISIFPMHDTHKKLKQAIHNNNIENFKEVLSNTKRSHMHPKRALHSSYSFRGRLKFTHALLKSGLVGPNNRDSDGNTLIHKAIRDKKINFIKRLMNYEKFNSNKKNKDGDAPLHSALNIVNRKTPCLNIIKIITRDPHIDFSIKNKENETPYEQAIKNLAFFSDIYNNRFLTTAKKKRNMRDTQKVIDYLKLAIDYQKAQRSKNIEPFLEKKNEKQLYEITSIALHQNNQITLSKIYAIDPESFAWPYLFKDAQEKNSPQCIPFLMSRMGITPEECLYIFDWQCKKQKTIKFSEERKKILNELHDVYATCSEKPLKPEIKKAMLNYFITIDMFYKIFNTPDIPHYIIEYTDIATLSLK